MKLVVLSYYYPPDQTPGSFRIASFIKSLEKRINVNDEIRVITTAPNRYSSYSIQASKEEVRKNITIERIWLPKHNNKVFFQIVGFLIFGFHTIRRMRRNKPDYIICTTGRHMTSLLAYICSLIYGVKYYVDFRDIFSEGLSQTYGERNKLLGIILKKFFLSLEKIVLKNASGINVVSQAFLPYYQEEGLDTSDWVFHPNGVDKNFLELDIAPKRSKKEIKTGNCMPLQDIPVGIDIHNVEIEPGAGGKIARSAGASVTISGLDGNYSLIKLASGEVRKIDSRALATIGVLSNPDQKNIKIGKAGRSRWLGRKPHTRGVVKNPVDHPHGGGEGKTAGGRHPVSPTGQSAKGLKTRDNKRTDKFIIKRRNKRKDTK